MWLFTNFGYLLPTITEDNDPMRKHEDWNYYSVGGKFTFQVRARLLEHLEYYLDNFAEEGTYGPIWRTPDHDYNYRVFTTQEAFAQATAKMVMAIDYRNFKDQSLKFPRGKEYHDLLLRIWGASCNLNEPGGAYGPWSPENPKGYKTAKGYHNWGSSEGRRLGDTFENIDFGDDENEDPEELAWWDGPAEDMLTEDDHRAIKIVNELDRMAIPVTEWPEYLTPNEWDVVEHIVFQTVASKKVVRSMRKRNRDNWAIEVETA